MNNEQRKTILKFLGGLEKFLRKWFQYGRINKECYRDSKEWLLGGDRLKVNNDGSCRSIDKEFIDKELLDMLLEVIAESNDIEDENRSAKHLQMSSSSPVWKTSSVWKKVEWESNSDTPRKTPLAEPDSEEDLSVKAHCNPSRKKKIKALLDLGYEGLAHYPSKGYQFFFDIYEGLDFQKKAICQISDQGWVEKFFAGDTYYEGAEIKMGHIDLIDKAISIGLNLGRDRLKVDLIRVMTRPSPQLGLSWHEEIDGSILHETIYRFEED